MPNFLPLLITGLMNGAIYALVALGFVLIYKASDVINFAQGELLLVGVYVTFALVAQTGFPLRPWPWPLAIAAALAVSVGLGVLIERLVLRPLIGEPIISVIMVTIGLSQLLRAIVAAIFGTAQQAFPQIIPNHVVELFGTRVTADRLWALGIAALLLLLLSLFFRYSTTGIAMRAAADDQQAALSMGISIKRIFAIAWSIAAVVATVGGLLVANITGGINTSLGDIGLLVFPVVILGGLDSIPGAIIGGIIIGMINAFSAGYLNVKLGMQGLESVLPYILLIIILMIRPYGLFGREIIERV
jgi:branched-chain amino acid transport system permease protein